MAWNNVTLTSVIVTVYVKLLTPSIGVYIARLTGGHIGEAEEQAPTFQCQGLKHV